MKVLDPFAGYRLASGHPMFHMSLFAGSYITDLYARKGVDIEDFSGYLETSFIILRWAHFSLFLVSMISEFANLDSSIPETKNDDSNPKYSPELMELK